MEFRLIDSQEDLKQAIVDLLPYNKIVLDTETTGLNPHVHSLRLVQICSADMEHLDKPVYIFDIFNLSNRDLLQEYIDSRDTVCCHNANFDLQFLKQISSEPKGNIFCTYVAERVLRSGYKQEMQAPQTKKYYFKDVQCTLAAVAKRRVGAELSKEQQVSDWGKEELDPEQLTYAAKDVKIMVPIIKSQFDELNNDNLMLTFSIEMKCIKPVAYMCWRGFNVDRDALLELLSFKKEALEQKTNEFVEALDERIDDREKKIPRNLDGTIKIGKNRAKGEFNPGSQKQLVEKFDLAHVLLPEAEPGKPTLNQVQLAEFDSSDSVLALYRERAKIETSVEHCEKILENINPITGRVHSRYNQCGANSGRFTSSGAKKVAKTKVKQDWAINIQQVPRAKDFRKVFIPAPGFKFVIADYSQIELRLAAELVGIPQMIDAFLNDIDLHSLTASLINNVTINEVTKEQRQDGKTLNFALLYGMGYKKYRTYAATGGKIIGLSEAKIAHAAFHRAYPRLKMWHQERSAMVRDGWVNVRTELGRRRLLAYDDCTMMSCANTLIQGTGADILKVAIANLSEHLGEDARLVACVHDELVLEVHSAVAERYKRLLSKVMVDAEKTVLKTVPSSADASIGDSWADK